ncbi:DNA mismatch repair protein MutT [Solitalea longa]|uniref:GDP-mannose pyrophosphatase n=1 Tax=Solitalea longa TaxID=2079460 RepID=A0A2S5A3K0_9SPHI|nr:NUDIX hydrolase [Solitalea longa]POY37094.1 DNA mismatch repair protein MutT [Solitalea longa]
MQNQENPWTTLSSTELYDNPWINLTEHKVINPSGGNGIYGVVSFKNYAIGIIPYDTEGNIWLVGQYRYATNSYSWEIPEGGGPLNIDPIKSAQRELLEETGLKAENWELLQEMYLSNSVTTEKALIYLATGLSQHEAEPEETEQLSIKKIPFEEALQMVFNGEITDAITITALYRLKLLLISK